MKPLKIWVVVYRGDPEKMPLAGGGPMLGEQNGTRAELIADWEYSFVAAWAFWYRHGYRCVRAEVRFIEGSKP